MPLPQPPVRLTDGCSVIYNDILYSYSADAFQQLPLEQGAKWTQLSNGVSVTGGVCVGTTPKDASQAALYIVGGTATSPDYQGLQKFTYSTGKWETVKPSAAVAQNRTFHGATYLNSTDSILIYAGSQDGSKSPSSQTFTISAKAPYGVTSYQSLAVPAVAPMLMPWSETEAAMIGGEATNTKVFLFNPATSWTESGVTLDAPITKDSSQVKAIISHGDDGSKSLYMFDMTVSPNGVTRRVLADAHGTPMTKAAPIVATSNGPHVEERALQIRQQLTMENWPTYNSSLAPQSTRETYSMAQDASGLVVISGGNDNDVLCMFSSRENCWLNATAQLADPVVRFASLPTTSTEPTSSATATPSSSSESTSSPTPVAAASSNEVAGMPPAKLLGIVLGSIFGVAILLIIALFLLKRQRRRQTYLEAGHQRRSSGLPPTDEKIDFLAMDTAKASGGAFGGFAGHKQQESQASFSSMAILMGKANKQAPAVQRKPSNDTKRSSTSSIMNKDFKSTIGRPVLQVSPIPEPEPMSRDERGVSFAANTATPAPRPRNPAQQTEGGMRRSSGWNRYWSGGSAMNILGFGGSKRTTVDSDQSSEYSDPRNRMTADSATVPPLKIEGRPSFSRVQSGSPTVAQYNNRINEGMTGQIERPISATSSSGYSSGIPASVHDAWDPTAATKPWGSDRAPSSAYSGSIYPSRPPTGVSRQPQLAMAQTSSDMSWLNLGENGRRI